MANRLPGVVRSSIVPIKGFDCHQVLGAASAKAFYHEGYRFCLRYLNIGISPIQEQVSYAECCHILDSGLALMLVQRVTELNWQPSASLGTHHGEMIAKLTGAMGIPEGMNLWCNLTGAGYTPNGHILDYCNHWFDAVHKWGFVPGMYVDPKNRLSSEELLLNLKFNHYWKSESRVPDVAGRGYHMIRGPLLGHSDVADGLAYHSNTLKSDRKGEGVFWLINNVLNIGH